MVLIYCHQMVLSYFVIILIIVSIYGRARFYIYSIQSIRCSTLLCTSTQKNKYDSYNKVYWHKLSYMNKT